MWGEIVPKNREQIKGQPGHESEAYPCMHSCAGESPDDTHHFVSQMCQRYIVAGFVARKFFDVRIRTRTHMPCMYICWKYHICVGVSVFIDLHKYSWYIGKYRFIVREY